MTDSDEDVSDSDEDDDEGEDDESEGEGGAADEGDEDEGGEKKAGKKRKKKALAAELDDDDLDLIEENTGQRVARPKAGRKLKKARETMDGDEPEAEQGVAVAAEGEDAEKALEAGLFGEDEDDEEEAPAQQPDTIEEINDDDEGAPWAVGAPPGSPPHALQRCHRPAPPLECRARQRPGSRCAKPPLPNGPLAQIAAQ